MQNKPILKILVGCPASGKSSYAEQVFCKNPHTIIISTDKIREELLGNESNQQSGNLIFETAYNRVRSALKLGLTVIFDSTAAKHKYRENLIKISKEYNSEIICYYFNTPLETCLIRNNKRKRYVAEEILCNIYFNIKKSPPSLAEGFDEIKVVENFYS